MSSLTLHPIPIKTPNINSNSGLVSGVDIKTLNGIDLLGPGNIEFTVEDIEGLDEIQSELSEIKDTLESVDNIAKASDFELGNINISATNWSYVPSTTRVRSRPSITYSLKKGDVIGLKDYSNARYFLGWKANGVFGLKGWLNTDYVVPEDAEYIVLLCNKTDTAQTDKYALFDLLRIEQASLLEHKVSVLESNVSAIFNTLVKSGVPTFIKGINHRGYSNKAPENTIPAYELSYQKGFKYVECDVAFTSDNIPVLLHDESIDRTSTGQGNIADLTYAEVSQYDFGSWFSSEFKNTKIPTLMEFLIFCRNKGLHPYLELKSNITKEQLTIVINLVRAYGLKNNVTYISFNYDLLAEIPELDPTARIGYVVNSPTATSLALVLKLITPYNDVFINSGTNSEEVVELCKLNNIPLELWVINNEDTLKNLNPYISGITSDLYNYGQYV